ncbi:MAG TPA: ABC transporter ATP-binding protein [Candidatus Ventricola intestinavium]|nr:ABC transporter ATP-binding protein [Candidatus Ventricola intestinavium]
MNGREEKKTAFSLTPWKRLWPFILRQKHLAIAAVGSNLVLALADFYFPLLQSRVVDRFIETGTLAGFGSYAAWYLAVVAVELIGLLIYFISCIRLEMLLSRDLKEACFVNLQRLSLDYYNVTSAGHTLSRVMTDTDRIANQVGWLFPDILWGFAYILGVFGVMLSLSPGLAMTLIAVAPLVTVLTVYFQKKLIALNRDVRAQHSKITSSYNEGIMGAKTSKTLALEEKLSAEFEQTTERAARAGILHGRMRAIYVPLIVLCGTLAASATLLRGGGMVMQGELSIGVLSAFMTYALSLFQTFRQQAQRISMAFSLQANVERVTDLVHETPTVRDSAQVEAKYGDCFHPKMENWEDMRGEVDFDDVSFTYPDGGEEVLSHFSLHVPAGSTVAIVGETGAGKSTLVNLVCRFFEPTGGRVLIDGRDVRERSQLWLHSHIGYVLQAPHLFSGTIRENIRYGRPDATDEEVLQAARAVHADTLAKKLPQGFDTDVGECGDKLSTGEKQLISFARAIIAKPRIFVLDEATSSVDTATEQLIQRATQTLMQGTTSFVIAHRLSTIRQADVILVIDHGKIVEQGTHDSLLKQRGAYYELYTTQLSSPRAV